MRLAHVILTPLHIPQLSFFFNITLYYQITTLVKSNSAYAKPTLMPLIIGGEMHETNLIFN